MEAVPPLAFAGLIKSILLFEASLARAESAVGIVPPQAAEAIVDVCTRWDGDVGAIAAAMPETLTPVVPLLADLRSQLPDDVARWLHFGATSQDAVDTAVSKMCLYGVEQVIGDLEGIIDACATLADQHRTTLLSGRTLLQPAVPITFGLKAAGWLVAAAEARAGLVVGRARLAVQLGGPAGTLSDLGSDGPRVVQLLAAHYGLAEPVMPWHTNRTRVAEAAAALGIAAGAVAKIAEDIVLLSQAEVAEVHEASKPGRGASSSMAHKRNPVLSIGALAAARRVPPLVATIFACMVQEHERAAGAWQAEWPVLIDLIDLTTGTTSGVAEALEGLEVDAGRMAENAKRLLGGDVTTPDTDAFVDRACSLRVG